LFDRFLSQPPVEFVNQRAGFFDAQEKETKPMSDNDILVAVYQTHTQAENAVKELQKSGFDMQKMSIVGRNAHAEEHVVGFYNAGDRMKSWGKAGAGAGAFWGGIWGLLFGAAFFAIPGMGPVLVAGPLVAWIVGALEGAVVIGGVGAIGAGLYSIGLPKDSVLAYEVALKTDKFFLMAHGTAAEAARAREILTGTSPLELHTHSLKAPEGTDALEREAVPVLVRR
jgi:hypothetical protein